MRLLLLFTFFIHGFCSIGQHSTLRFSESPINLNRQSVLLIPFESKMFLTDINKALAENNNLNSQQIIDRFSTAIDQSITYAFQQNCDVSSFYQIDDSTAQTQLNYIYNNLKLDYELVSVTEERSKTQQLKDKLKKKEDPAYQRSKIQGGQIITKRDDRKRYMKAVVTDNAMLDSMHFQFDNKFFLFVNQLDIRNDYSDMIAVQQGAYDRIIQLHYTLYHKDGTILSTGVSATNFPNQLNDINKIISGYFPTLAQNIFVDLFPPQEEEEKKSKLNFKPWK